MFLSSFDVDTRLHQAFDSFLAMDTCTFTVLQNLIISKNPVPLVHDTIAHFISELTLNDKEEEEKKLIDSAYKQQVNEDELEKKTDNEYKQRDVLETKRLLEQQQLKINQLHSLEAQLLAIPSLPITSAVHQHEHSDSHQHTHTNNHQHHQHHHQHDSNHNQTHTHADSTVNQDNSALKLTLQNNIISLTKELESFNALLNAINQRNLKRDLQLAEREARQQARLELHGNKEGSTVYATLSLSTHHQLTNDIKAKQLELDALCASLTAKAKHLNYSIFLEQLEIHLKTNPTHRKLDEIEALRYVLSMMKQHQLQQEETALFQKKLNDKKQAISNDKNTLEQSKLLLEKLESITNPNLVNANILLQANNVARRNARESNTKIITSFSKPTWISLGLSVVSALPLLLFKLGLLPAIPAAPIYLALLVSPPAVLFLVTLVLSVIVASYVLKNHLNSKAIQRNERSIQSNIAQMGENHEKIRELEEDVIAILEVSIPADVAMIPPLALCVEKSLDLEKQYLDNAAKCMPVNKTDLNFFAANSHAHPSITVVPNAAPTAPPLDTGEVTSLGC